MLFNLKMIENITVGTPYLLDSVTDQICFEDNLVRHHILTMTVVIYLELSFLQLQNQMKHLKYYYIQYNYSYDIVCEKNDDDQKTFFAACTLHGHKYQRALSLTRTY